MGAIIIETSRDDYAPNQIRRTMTVGELVELLQDYEESTKIYLSFDRGYTYGGISADCISEQEDEDDE